MIFSVSVNSYSFGTVDQGSTRISDTNVSFRIDLLNLNNRTLELKPSVQGLEKGNVSFPAKRTIKPSKISENPKGSGWITFEPGRYAKPETFRFNVISSKKETGEDNFKFQIQAQTIDQDDGSELNQRVVQVREYSYSIKRPEKETRPSIDRGFEEPEDSDIDPEIIKQENEEEENSNESQSEGNISINDTDISKATKTSDNSTSTEPSTKVDSVTVILSAGVMASIAYIWMIL